ncbi:MAG: metalloregulator ArsR/SmtB family transcription factor [Proteobacteria bacterium]|nr:metalloregulator ArsR/SmtB family transcription factor [Pseudomonadota bacterium]MBU1709791.1 metalloregulator ArsR/SmtB family transcription factor [Pseudomonadota bacterium]
MTDSEALLKDLKIREAATCLKTLAHESRLRVMCALVDGEKNVQELMKVTGASQSNLSQHLAKMRDKGLLEFRREANQIFYSIADRKLLEILTALRTIFCN